MATGDVTGKYRLRGAEGVEDYAQVEDSAGISIPMDESEYRRGGYQPPFDELPWAN